MKLRHTPLWALGIMFAAGCAEQASDPMTPILDETLAPMFSANAATVLYTSGSNVLTWDPIGVPTDTNWGTTVCTTEPAISLTDTRWVNQHNAVVMGHPWAGWFFNAPWINAWNTNQSVDSGAPGPGNHNWTKYQTTVSGTGDYVVQLLADNCSWIYLDDTLVGVQGAAFSASTVTYGVTLSGEHTLDFIIFDGGGAAGGKFRLETNGSFASNGGDTTTVQPPPVTNEAPVADASLTPATVEFGTPVTLDGSAASDSDGTIVSWEWSEGGVSLGSGETLTTSLTMGGHTITLTVTDDDGATGTYEVTIDVVDTTAPAVTAALTTSGLKSLKNNQGLFEVGFTCQDTGDPNATPSAVLNGTAVSNGQIVDLRLRNKSKKGKSDKDRKSDKSRKYERFDATSFELVVTCVDASSNVGTATAAPTFADKSEKSEKSDKSDKSDKSKKKSKKG